MAEIWGIFVCGFVWNTNLFCIFIIKNDILRQKQEVIRVHRADLLEDL